MNYRKILMLGLAMCLTLGVMAQKPNRYQLKVGDQFRVRAEINQDITQTMLGQEMETKQTISTVDLYEVVEAGKNEYLLRTTGLSRSMFTETAAGSVTMDSDLEGDESLAFRVLTGKSYSIRMNQYGRMMGFEGMDEMKQAVREELKGTVLEASADELLAAFDEETLKSAFEGQFYIYKEPGQSYSRSFKMEVSGLPIEADINFERKSSSLIEATGAMSMSGEFEVMGQMMTADMAGDQTSQFTLDAKTGIAKNIKTTQNMDGDLQVSDLSVPMKLKTTVTVTVTW